MTISNLASAGVSVWLDELNRPLLASGELAEMVQRGVVGVTSNPTIFAKAVGGNGYHEELTDLARRGVSVGEAVRMLTCADVRRACDVLEPVFRATDGVDGMVSLEVDPRLAHDTDATVAEARALVWLVDRPNLMVKVPATPEGVHALEECVSEGISVNMTLVFSLERYEDVVQAYVSGLERAREAGRDLASISSVASFFVSRVDAAVDPLVEESLRGRVGIANAQRAYRTQRELLDDARWKSLTDDGARVQRLLWASTGVKGGALADTAYVEALALPGTVNTMTPATLEAVEDHGRINAEGALEGLTAADATLDELERSGVELSVVVAELERSGIEKFEDSWRDLARTVEVQLEGE